MATRNPMNERNQEGGKKGVTRKSAASAKPKAKAAASVYIKDPNYKPKKKLSERLFGNGEDTELSKNQQRKIARQQAEEEKSREEAKANYKKRRAKKYTLLDMEYETRTTDNLSEEDQKAAEKRYRNPGTAAYKRWRTIWWVCIILGICSLIPPIVNPDWINNGQETITYSFYALGWIFLLAAIAIDALRIRPLRKNARYGKSTDKSKAASKARKQAKARANQQAAEARRKAQENK